MLRQASACLGHHYGRRLPAITANLYRDGNDSVAWHGDTVRHVRNDTVDRHPVAGLATQAPAAPDRRRPVLGYELHSGDLLVMGGTCQTTWQHCVPKRARAGPRDQRDVPRARRALTRPCPVSRAGGAHLGGIPERPHRRDAAVVVEGHHVDDVDRKVVPPITGRAWNGKAASPAATRTGPVRRSSIESDIAVVWS